ncbi:uncharacterized protein ColSpa_12460 [Colletotrichum spaethianum]|uniref:Uncharacterized protein n=1 Tax=Colletotrichum spaethianum TaxID=700344 RepID=A0AA37PHF1_9PEZI|nr:uncharacterized protein ColSpa_12460 [Colletotrichum spaethianum]GKT52279.1 hypothetical protein ColSpa_12460 [Colletotrichum spaethianum]
MPLAAVNVKAAKSPADVSFVSVVEEHLKPERDRQKDTSPAMLPLLHCFESSMTRLPSPW